ncbi:MAG: hypothetical protein HRF40_01275 [Nitrososphaera sp.]
MTTYAKYLYVGIIIVVVSGSMAVYLNFQGVTCLTDLARIDQSVVPPDQVADLEASCAVVTNSYVYSIYAVATGAILVISGFVKKRRSNTS